MGSSASVNCQGRSSSETAIAFRSSSHGLLEGRRRKCPEGLGGGEVGENELVGAGGSRFSIRVNKTSFCTDT